MSTFTPLEIQIADDADGVVGFDCARRIVGEIKTVRHAAGEGERVSDGQHAGEPMPLPGVMLEPLRAVSELPRRPLPPTVPLLRTVTALALNCRERAACRC